MVYLHVHVCFLQCTRAVSYEGQTTSTPCKDVHVCALCLCISVSPLETPCCCHHGHEVLSQSQPLFSSLSSFLCVWVCFPASPGAQFKKQIWLHSPHWFYIFMTCAHWLPAAVGAASQNAALQLLVMGRLYSAALLNTPPKQWDTKASVQRKYVRFWYTLLVPLCPHPASAVVLGCTLKALKCLKLNAQLHVKGGNQETHTKIQ